MTSKCKRANILAFWLHKKKGKIYKKYEKNAQKSRTLWTVKGNKMFDVKICAAILVNVSQLLYEKKIKVSKYEP